MEKQPELLRAIFSDENTPTWKKEKWPENCFVYWDNARKKFIAAMTEEGDDPDEKYAWLSVKPSVELAIRAMENKLELQEAYRIDEEINFQGDKNFDNIPVQDILPCDYGGKCADCPIVKKCMLLRDENISFDGEILAFHEPVLIPSISVNDQAYAEWVDWIIFSPIISSPNFSVQNNASKNSIK